jgi:hypothetical protein
MHMSRNIFSKIWGRLSTIPSDEAVYLAVQGVATHGCNNDDMLCLTNLQLSVACGNSQVPHSKCWG